MKRKTIAAVSLAVLLIVGILGFLTVNPIISHKAELPRNYIEAIESQAEGFYSKTLPLIPVYVSVEEFTGNKVYYTIHYFPFGTVEMSYTENDGYNIEKPLTNL